MKPGRCPVCKRTSGRALVVSKDLTYDTPGEFQIISCEECGFRFTSPVPDADEFGVYYPEQYYSKPPVLGRVQHSERFRRLSSLYSRTLYKRFTAPDPGIRLRLLLLSVHRRVAAISLPYAERPGRLLDVGCNTGNFLAAQLSLGWECHGVDMSPVAVRDARARGLDVRAGTLREQAWPDGFFDVVNINHVLEHTPDPVAELKEIRRVLAPGGFVRIGVPLCPRALHVIFGKYWGHYDLPRHLHHFDMKGLERCIESAGLRTGMVWFTTTTTSIANSLRLVARHRWNSPRLVRFFSPNNRLLRAMLFPGGVVLKLLRMSLDVVVWADIPPGG